MEEAKSIYKTLPKGVYTVPKETPSGPIITLASDRELTSEEKK